MPLPRAFRSVLPEMLLMACVACSGADTRSGSQYTGRWVAAKTPLPSGNYCRCVFDIAKRGPSFVVTTDRSASECVICEGFDGMLSLTADGTLHGGFMGLPTISYDPATKQILYSDGGEVVYAVKDDGGESTPPARSAVPMPDTSPLVEFDAEVETADQMDAEMRQRDSLQHLVLSARPEDLLTSLAGRWLLSEVPTDSRSTSVYEFNYVLGAPWAFWTVPGRGPVYVARRVYRDSVELQTADYGTPSRPGIVQWTELMVTFRGAQMVGRYKHYIRRVAPLDSVLHGQITGVRVP